MLVFYFILVETRVWGFSCPISERKNREGIRPIRDLVLCKNG